MQLQCFQPLQLCSDFHSTVQQSSSPVQWTVPFYWCTVTIIILCSTLRGITCRSILLSLDRSSHSSLRKVFITESARKGVIFSSLCTQKSVVCTRWLPHCHRGPHRNQGDGQDWKSGTIVGGNTSSGQRWLL